MHVKSWIASLLLTCSVALEDRWANATDDSPTRKTPSQSGATNANQDRGPLRGMGMPGPGGPMGQHQELVEKFDKNNDGWLNRKEREAAREQLKKTRPARGRGFGSPGGFGPPSGMEDFGPPPGFGPPGGFGPPPGFGPPGGGRRGGPGGRENRQKPKAGPRVKPADVKSYPDATFYDPHVVRTLFIDFDDKDWESELSDFYHTDVEVPATLTVDGKKYPNVGIHFRGASSYFTVSDGYKRSLNVTIDFLDSKQRLYGQKTLNLLNSHEDPSFLSSVLYSQIARQYIPAPKANFVKVVINGESWGLYANLQQFNKDFVRENFKSGKGARWKVKGSPGGGGGLDYIGENVAAYRRRYELKSDEDPNAWKALIDLCRTLKETPPEKLKSALEPILDVDGVLWFLALDVALINCDGYWIRASDYSLFRDDKGKFHTIPHDMNEAFRPPMGPGMGPGPGFGMGPGGPGGFGSRGGARKAGLDGDREPPRRFDPDTKKQDLAKSKEARLQPARRGGNVDLDPLIGLDDPRKPLRSKLLAVPELKEKYLQHVRTIAEQSLDWNKMGPIVANYRKLIENEIRADTKKLSTFEEFEKAIRDTLDDQAPPARRGPPTMNLRTFFERRRNYLLNYQKPVEAKSNNA